jgi:ABC-type uncharacterized transport system substrate-binding protein
MFRQSYFFETKVAMVVAYQPMQQSQLQPWSVDPHASASVLPSMTQI